MSSHTLTICGLDPSTNFVGLSVFKLDAATLEILKIETHLFDISKAFRGLDIFTEPITEKLNHLYNVLTDYWTFYTPCLVVYESGYMNPRQPTAYKALLDCASTIKASVNEYNPQTPVFTKTPGQGKLAVGTKRHKGKPLEKSDVTEAILDVNELSNHYDFTNVSEHEIDSTVILYSQLIQIREDPGLLCLIKM